MENLLCTLGFDGPEKGGRTLDGACSWLREMEKGRSSVRLVNSFDERKGMIALRIY